MTKVESNRILGRKATRQVSATDSNDSDGESSNEELVPVLEQAIEGTVTKRGRSPPISTVVPLTYRGTVYELEKRVSVADIPHSYLIEIVPPDAQEGHSGAVEAETTSFDDLPAVDRTRLDDAFSEARERKDVPLEVTREVFYDESSIKQSDLVPEQKYAAVEYAGTQYMCRVTDEEIPKYEYTAKQRAPTLAAFGKELQNQYEFELTDLSSDEKSVVESAAGGTYDPGADDDDFRSVAQQILSHERVPHTERYLIRWRGASYLTKLSIGYYEELAE